MQVIIIAGGACCYYYFRIRCACVYNYDGDIFGACISLKNTYFVFFHFRQIVRLCERCACFICGRKNILADTLLLPIGHA